MIRFIKMRHMRGLFTTDDSGEVAVSLVKREKKCWEIHEVVRVAVRSAPSAVVYRVYGGREGEDGGESEIETGRERERDARAHSFGFTPLSRHTRCSRATCSVLDREADRVCGGCAVTARRSGNYLENRCLQLPELVFLAWVI